MDSRGLGFVICERIICIFIDSASSHWSPFLYIFSVLFWPVSSWVRHTLMGRLIHPSRPGWWSDGWMPPFLFPFSSPASLSSTLSTPILPHVFPNLSLIPSALSALLFFAAPRGCLLPHREDEGGRGYALAAFGHVGVHSRECFTRCNFLFCRSRLGFLSVWVINDVSF